MSVEELSTTFLIFDKNGDGAITIDELDIAMRAFGHNPTEAELRVLITEVEYDRNGALNFPEFLTLMATQMKLLEDGKEILHQFRALDRDGNGLISSEDLHYVLTNLGEEPTDEDVNEIINEADLNEDNQIDYGEYITMMTNNNNK